MGFWKMKKLCGSQRHLVPGHIYFLDDEYAHALNKEWASIGGACEPVDLDKTDQKPEPRRSTVDAGAWKRSKRVTSGE